MTFNVLTLVRFVLIIGALGLWVLRLHERNRVEQQVLGFDITVDDVSFDDVGKNPRSHTDAQHQLPRADIRVPLQLEQ